MEENQSKRNCGRRRRGGTMSTGRKFNFDMNMNTPQPSSHHHRLQDVHFCDELANTLDAFAGMSSICSASEVPDVEGADVVLNRRGTPVRARKRSRHYFDDVDMLSFSPGGNEYEMYTSMSPSCTLVDPQFQEDVKPDMEQKPPLRQEVAGASTNMVSAGKRVSAGVSGEKLKTSKEISKPHRTLPRPQTRSFKMRRDIAESGPPPPPTPVENTQTTGTKKGKSKKSISTPADIVSSVEKKTTRSKITSKTVPVASDIPPPAGSQFVNGAASPAPSLKRSSGKNGEKTSKSKKGNCLSAPGALKISPLPSMPDLSLLLTQTSDSGMSHEPAVVPPRPRVKPVDLCKHYFKDDATARQQVEAIGLRLRNILKLPKAHKWVYFEWFYSDLDRSLFEKENDFETCLRTNFPALKTRMLTKAEWSQIRKIMGKPRRCSQNFFDQEREELARRRLKVRMIQQRIKLPDDWDFSDLPDQIPLLVSVGSKVTARIRRPQDGIFTGTVEGMDPSNNTYRVNFDRDFGAQSVVDYEVMSQDTPDTVSVSSFSLKLTHMGAPIVSRFTVTNPALLEKNLPEGLTSPLPANGMLGGFPVRLLELIVRLSKSLKMKREKVWNLRELNVEMEKLKTYGKRTPEQFLVRYSRCVTDIDAVNEVVNKIQKVIRLYLKEVPGADASLKLVDPLESEQITRREAALLVSTFGRRQPTSERNSMYVVQSPKIYSFIEMLTCLLLQLRERQERAADGTTPGMPFEMECLQRLVRQAKASLKGCNVSRYEALVEVPFCRIMAGLCVAPNDKTPGTFKTSASFSRN